MSEKFEEIQEIFAHVPSSSLPAERLGGDGVDLTTLIAEVGLTTSRGEARRAVEQGGVYLNGERVDDVGSRVTANEALEGAFLVLRRGKKHYHLIQVAR